MNSDSKIINEIIGSQALNGMALLLALDITPTQIADIKKGAASLRTAERMLLSILIKQPDALDFITAPEGDFQFSNTAWRKSLKSVDEQIEDLLDEIRKEHKKSGLSVDEFTAGTRSNNVYRRKVHEFFMGLCEKDLIGKDAARVYQTPFWKSFKSGAAFKRSNYGNRWRTQVKTSEKTSDCKPL